MMNHSHLPTHRILSRRLPYTALGVGMNRAEVRTDGGAQNNDSERRKENFRCDNLDPVVVIRWDKESGFTVFNVISFGAVLIVFSFLVGLAV